MRKSVSRALAKLNKILSEGKYSDEQFKEFLSSTVGEMAAEIGRFETVLDSLNEGLLVCDAEHRLLLANKAAKRFLPLGEAGIAVWNSVYDDDISSFLKTSLGASDKVEDREFEIESGGAARLLSVNVLPLVKEFKVSGTLVIFRDITEKRRGEARLRRMENLASLTTLAAGVAHEIKNPLGSISIHMQLLKKAMAKNEELYRNSHPEDYRDPNHEAYVGPNGYFNLFKKYTGVIDEEIERLNRIVVDFLFAVRPMNLEMREGDINQFIKNVFEFVRYELAEAKVETALELAENLPRLDFDERILKQALLNLIQNAVAAMPGGGTLTVKTSLAEGGVEIAVADTGTGISDENLSKIFEPYFTTKETGSGLGLTLVFKIVREHSGEIAVKSKEGEGTTFTITLPVPQRERRLLPGADKEAASAL